MTNGECIYHETVDYMSRMALEKDDFVSTASLFSSFMLKAMNEVSW